MSCPTCSEIASKSAAIGNIRTGWTRPNISNPVGRWVWLRGLLLPWLGINGVGRDWSPSRRHRAGSGLQNHEGSVDLDVVRDRCADEKDPAIFGEEYGFCTLWRNGIGGSRRVEGFGNDPPRVSHRPPRGRRTGNRSGCRPNRLHRTGKKSSLLGSLLRAAPLALPGHVVRGRHNAS